MTTATLRGQFLILKAEPFCEARNSSDDFHCSGTGRKSHELTSPDNNTGTCTDRITETHPSLKIRQQSKP